MKSELAKRDSVLRSQLNTLVLYSRKKDLGHYITPNDVDEILEANKSATTKDEELSKLISDCLTVLRNSDIELYKKSNLICIIESNPLQDQAVASNRNFLNYSLVAFALGWIALAIAALSVMDLDKSDFDNDNAFAAEAITAFIAEIDIKVSPIAFCLFYAYNWMTKYGDIDKRPENFKAWIQGIVDALPSVDMNNDENVMTAAEVVVDAERGEQTLTESLLGMDRLASGKQRSSSPLNRMGG